MNPYIEKLSRLGQAPQRRILGLMSGTSLDGLDMAVCLFTGSGGNTRVILEYFHTEPYSPEFREKLAPLLSGRTVDLQYLCMTHAWIGICHARIINHQLGIWGLNPQEIDLIASHGQTIYHAPRSLHQEAGFPNSTLQLGDGDHIAQLTQIITLSDFRQKHVAAGGEGAPLAPYGDALLLSHPAEARLLVNIGGIANFTYLPGLLSEEKIESSDLGPGNTLMDAYVKAHFEGYTYDPDGRFAASGTVDSSLLEALFRDPFFAAPFPKSTGPERFNLDWLKVVMDRDQHHHTGKEDMLATLSEFTACSIVKGIAPYQALHPEVKIYLSGGGIHNKTVVDRIQQKISPSTCHSTASLGMNPDAKEAILFAALANECLAGSIQGNGLQVKDRPGGLVPMVSMGKISLPN